MPQQSRLEVGHGWLVTRGCVRRKRTSRHATKEPPPAFHAS